MRPAFLLLLFALSAACSPGPRTATPGPALEEILTYRPRILWVAAHPDDESMASGLLVRACVQYRSACHFLVLNRGGGGECCRPEGCAPDLGTVRHEEMQRAARLYRATLEHYDFFNAPLPVASFPSVPELERRWLGQGDPIGLCARAIRRFHPDLVVTFSPYRGFTGHPEHRAAARVALAGVQLAARDDATDPLLRGEPPYRVPWVVQVLNKYWLWSLVGNSQDPMPYSWSLDLEQRCQLGRDGEPRSCLAMAGDFTRVHRSQDGDMTLLRAGLTFMGTTFVRQIDPYGAEANRLVAGIGRTEPLPATP